MISGNFNRYRINRLLRILVNSIRHPYKVGRLNVRYLVGNAIAALNILRKERSFSKRIRLLLVRTGIDKNFQQVNAVRKKMLDLGFSSRARAELESFVGNTTKPFRQKLAARELIIWHLNKYTEWDAKKALNYFPIAVFNETDIDAIRRNSILEAEAHLNLGDTEKARHILLAVLEQTEHPDVYLGLANVEVDIADKLLWINRVFKYYNLPDVSFGEDLPVKVGDRLDLKSEYEQPNFQSLFSPKISVIMPAHNSEKTIEIAIRSVLSQSWHNLELIVVNDCSTDKTIDIVNTYVHSDSRIILINTQENSGPYIARNIALSIASGEFVTCHDADDWSHVKKLEIQVKHLLSNPDVVANLSQQARVTSDLNFYRRGNSGHYIFANMSSLLFRRKLVLDELGCWDSIRFGADAEFIRRIKHIFGSAAIEEIAAGPISFQRQSFSSLTGNSAFGYHGYYMGARREYFYQQCEYHHSGKSLRYEFPQRKRPFFAPNPMLPNYSNKSKDPKYYDIIFATDYRWKCGIADKLIKTVESGSRDGFSIGLVQMSEYNFNPNAKMNDKIRNLMDEFKVNLLVYGEHALCDVLVVCDPIVLEDMQNYIPHIDAADVYIVRVSDRKEAHVKENSKKKCNNNSLHYFNRIPKWLFVDEIPDTGTLRQLRGRALNQENVLV